MRDAGDNDLLEISKDALERFALLGRVGRQRFLDVPRHDLGEHRIALRVTEIPPDPTANASKVVFEIDLVVHAMRSWPLACRSPLASNT